MNVLGAVTLVVALVGAVVLRVRAVCRRQPSRNVVVKK